MYLRLQNKCEKQLVSKHTFMRDQGRERDRETEKERDRESKRKKRMRRELKHNHNVLNFRNFQSNKICRIFKTFLIPT